MNFDGLFGSSEEKEEETSLDSILKAEELMKDTTSSFSEPKIHIPVIKEVPPTQASATSEDSNKISSAMKGRLESDIPMSDSYWKIKNSIIRKLK